MERQISEITRVERIGNFDERRSPAPAYENDGGPGVPAVKFASPASLLMLRSTPRSDAAG